MIPEKLSDESPDTDFQTSWDETQQRLESCGTHSYIEETGCLQSTRSTASFYTKLDRLSLLSGPTRTQVSARIHPPAPSLCLHSSETQEKPALPLSCAQVSQALDVMSERHKRKAGMGLIECSSDFEAAWKAADPVHNCEKINPYAVTDSNLSKTLGQTAPHTNQTSFFKGGTSNSENKSLSSSPAILHLPLHCQTQIRGRASWDTNSSHHGSFFGGNSSEAVMDSKQNGTSPTTEERNGIVVIRSTDRAVFSDIMDAKRNSDGSKPFSFSLRPSSVDKQGIFSGVSLGVSGAKYISEISSRGVKEGIEVPCELLGPGDEKSATKEGLCVGMLSSAPPGASPHGRLEERDLFLRAERPEEQGEDQIIEVDGWCHLPRFPVKTSRPADKTLQTCWGLPEAEVCVWGAQILLALESLHQQGIMCRDLNPKNVLLTCNGESIK